MSDPTKAETTRRDGLEEAARIADFYAVENFRLASDIILTDPILSGRGGPNAAMATFARLQSQGHMHASMAHAAQHIAAAIRERMK